MRILIIGVVTLVLVLAIALTGFNTSTQSSEESTNTQEVTLKVDGMTCELQG